MLRDENSDQKTRYNRFILGTSSSPRMRAVLDQVKRVSNHLYPVLILGETGTGKEVIARAIHNLSQRRFEPFVPVDCASISPTLFETELFGHAIGAFTGAVGKKRGLMESAAKGTLFLDEIGDMPLPLQAKLLRVLQEREIRPVGSTQTVPFMARILAATNRNLEFATKKGEFRRDLYFRLNIMEINLPPLRQRLEDFLALATGFIEQFRDPGTCVNITNDVLEAMLKYAWPGNIRELENAIQCAIALGSGPFLSAGDFPERIQQSGDIEGSEDVKIEDIRVLRDGCTFAETERRAIDSALRETKGDRVAAARLLNIGKTTIYRKLKSYRAKVE